MKTTMYADVVTIADEAKKVVVVNIDESQIKMDAPKLHHIHILDRSSSMRNEIDALIDNVQNTLSSIHDDDLVSVIWFSSPGNYRTLVKGASNSQELKDLLNSLRSAEGSTCFSDPIKEANLLVDDLYSLCPNISVTLFTDGQTVTSWEKSEETRRIFDELKKLSPRILALNTIGYGPYYDQQLLKKMSLTTQFGEMIHSSKIQDYLTIFDRHFEKLRDSVTVSVDLAAPEAGNIIYLSRKFVREGDTSGTLVLSRLDKEKNQFFILGKTTADFNFSLNGKEYSSADIVTAPRKETITNLKYAIASNDYYSGRRYHASSVLADIGDKALVDAAAKAFTFDEVAAYSSTLLKAVFSTKARSLDGICDKNYLPAKDAFCVLDVMNILFESDSKYSPFGKNVDAYQRTTRKVLDNYNQFKFPEAEVLASFSDFVPSSEFLNLSVRFPITGSVQLNPASAKRVGLPDHVPATIFRNHSIINDGVLNLPKIEVLLDHKAFSKLSASGMFENGSKILGITTISDVDYTRAVLDMRGLPMLNRLYVPEEIKPEMLLSKVERLTTLEARQLALNSFMTQVYELNPVAKKVGEFKDLTLDQIQVLEDSGLNSKFWYSPVESLKPAAEAADYYEAKSITFNLKGISSLASVSDVLTRISEKGIDKLTSSQKYVYSALMSVAAAVSAVSDQVCDISTMKLRKAPNAVRDELERLVTDNKLELRKERTELVALKMAVVLSGDWFEGFKSEEPRAKSNSDISSFSKDDTTLILKSGKVKRYI